MNTISEQFKAGIQWKTIEKPKIEREYQKQENLLNLKTSHDYARAATRNIIFGNGAALIALLSFVGQMMNPQVEGTIEKFMQGLKVPSTFFLGGILFGMVAAGCGFVSTQYWAGVKSSDDDSSGTTWAVISAGTAILGGVCFLAGALWTIRLFSGFGG